MLFSLFRDAFYLYIRLFVCSLIGSIDRHTENKRFCAGYFFLILILSKRQPLCMLAHVLGVYDVFFSLFYIQTFLWDMDLNWASSLPYNMSNVFVLTHPKYQKWNQLTKRERKKCVSYASNVLLFIHKHMHKIWRISCCCLVLLREFDKKIREEGTTTTTTTTKKVYSQNNEP